MARNISFKIWTWFCCPVSHRPVFTISFSFTEDQCEMHGAEEHLPRNDRKICMSTSYSAQSMILHILTTCIIVALLGLFFGHCPTGLNASPLSPLNTNVQPISGLRAAPRTHARFALASAWQPARCRESKYLTEFRDSLWIKKVC